MSKHDDPARKPGKSEHHQPSPRPAGPSWRRWLIVGLSALVLLYIMNILAGAIPAPWDRERQTAVRPSSAGEPRADTLPKALPAQPPLAASPATQSKTVTAVQANAAGEIHLASTTLIEGKVQFYQYTNPSGERVGFLAVKDAQGAIHTAIDNCKECFHAHKGYTQRGQELICGECGKGLAVAYLGEATGDCHPLDLPSTTAGDEVVVRVADLAAANASGAGAGVGESAGAGAGDAITQADEAKEPATRVQPNPAGEVRIASAALADGKARFYEFTSPFGAQIRFFAIRDAQGTLHAAIDNCLDCFQTRRGYTQRGTEMVCRNCGRSSPIASINKLSGGCNPIGLPFTTAGDELVIKTADLVTLDAGGTAAAPEQPSRLRF